jgi:hypothetical protein
MNLFPSHIRLQYQQETDPSITHVPVGLKSLKPSHGIQKMPPPHPPRNTRPMVPKPLKSLKVSVHQGRHQSPWLLEASLPTSKKSLDVINNTTPVALSFGENSDVANDDDKVNPEDR